jgi:transposase InsO family protein
VPGKSNQNTKPIHLRPIPAVCEPFNYLIMDCVGPLPCSKTGSEYLLTIMCQVTRYTAAFALRSITAISVIKAFSQFMSVFRIPHIIQSDRGNNFTSGVFEELLRQLNIKHNISTAYHPQN